MTMFDDQVKVTIIDKSCVYTIVDQLMMHLEVPDNWHRLDVEEYVKDYIREKLGWSYDDIDVFAERVSNEPRIYRVWVRIYYHDRVDRIMVPREIKLR